MIESAPASALPGIAGALAEAEALVLMRLKAGRPVADPGGTTLPGALGDDRLLTYKEAAEWLRASESYVETLVRQGKLRAITLPATAKGSGEHARERSGRARRIRSSTLRHMVHDEAA